MRWFIEYEIIIEDAKGDLLLEETIIDVVEGDDLQTASDKSIHQSVDNFGESVFDSMNKPSAELHVEVKIIKAMKVDEKAMKRISGA